MNGSRVALLGEVLKPRNEIVHPHDHPVGSGTFVGLEHIESGTGHRIGSLEVDLAGLTGRKARFRTGDIVYGYLRPYLNKVWVAEFDGYCSVDQYVFSVATSADADYVAMYLRSPEYLRLAPVTNTPGQLPRIRTDEVLSVPVPLPPFEEQRRIVTELASRLSVVDRARDTASQMKVEVAQLRSEVVDEAFADPVPARVPISRVGTLDDGDWILTGDYAPSGIRLLQVGDVRSGALRVTSNRFISPQRAQELNCTLLRPCDILIARMPDPIGRACLLPDLGYPAITAVDVTIFRPDEHELDPEFAVLYMNGRTWLNAVADKASGATRARISRKNLEQQLIPLPALSDQHRIAAELTERLAIIDSLVRALDLQVTAIRALPAALLRRAFGEKKAAQLWS